MRKLRLLLAPVLAAILLLGPSLGLQAASAKSTTSSMSISANAIIDPTIPIEPLLQVAAQLDPKTTVRVIIQKADPLANATRHCQVSHRQSSFEEFSVIPAFTATLK